MSLPLARSRLVFYSQTIDGRPFVNCLPYSICSVVRWTGYKVPPTWGMDLRVASGVPVEPHRGTNYRVMKKALTALLPAAMAAKVIIFGKVTEAELLADLPRFGRANKTKDVYSVSARYPGQFPRYLRRHVGYSFVGAHAVALGGYRLCNGADGGRHVGHVAMPEVYWMDPMGRTTQGYSGEWAPWDHVKGSLMGRTTDGYIKCVHAQKGTAI